MRLGPASVRNLHSWLEYQQSVHPKEIALGLERIKLVAARMVLPKPAPVTITVAGTNGKGSTVALLEAILIQAGYRVGSYTSPHLLRYNERVKLGGEAVHDAMLIDAFGRIESNRQAVPLTYFEYGTLAAFDIFARQAVDVAILEVGMGGRFDAVNWVEADVAVITTVDLDHQAYLGDDREQIGFEKAGILRPEQHVVLGERAPPDSVLQVAARLQVRLQRLGRDFSVERTATGCQWRHSQGTTFDLPLPPLAAPAQLDNLASAVAALHALSERLPVSAQAMCAGVASVRIPGRLQRMATGPEMFVDVGHNPQAARELALWLDAQPQAKKALVFSILKDKDLRGVAQSLAGRAQAWFVLGLVDETERGGTAEAIATQIALVDEAARVLAVRDMKSAIAAARNDVGRDGLVLIFGSFYLVARALAFFGEGET